MQIRAEFERHRYARRRACLSMPMGLSGNDNLRYRHVTDPRALAILFEHAEAWLAANAHPDPYIRMSYDSAI